MALRRSVGISLIGFGFLALSIALFVITERVHTNPSDLAQFGTSPQTTLALGFAAGLTAAAVAFGVWTRAPWLRGAMVVWGLSAAAIMLARQHASDLPHEPRWMILFPYVALLLVIGMLWRYTDDRV
jgi:peptidoglycan/LPS O-acetylase OafA/YrhL